MKKVMLIVLGMILVSFAISAYLYPSMPEQVASHWNARGEVDGYMPKFWGLFMMPIISLGMLLLFIAIPKIDPLKSNIKKFMNYYEGMILTLIAFMFYIYLLTIFWSLGYVFDMMQMMIPALGFLFIYMGFLVEKAKRNWFVGIRTPWTLSNEKVWDKTHHLGGKLFKAAGVITLFGMAFPDYAIWILLVPILGVSLYLIVYSYLEYRKETKK
jgi:uncharacterized membrane protein